MRTTLGALALAGLMALTGCTVPVSDPAADVESTAPTASVLDGQWRLVSATDAQGKLALKTSITTIALTGEDTGGKAPCNTYNATVEIGAGHDIAIPKIAQTKMACEDATLTDIETRYVNALTLVIRTDIIEKQLVLSNEDEQVNLTFDAVSVPDGAALVGTNWQLESILSGVAPDLVAGDATGSGSILFNGSDFEASGGCSAITGDYEIVGGILISSNVEIDVSDCDAALLPQEKVAVSVLRGPAILTLDDTELTISAAALKAGLLFRASNN